VDVVRDAVQGVDLDVDLEFAQGVDLDEKHDQDVAS